MSESVEVSFNLHWNAGDLESFVFRDRGSFLLENMPHVAMAIKVSSQLRPMHLNENILLLIFEIFYLGSPS